MNPYVRKGWKRTLLHGSAFMGATGTTSYLLWVNGVHHFFLIPGLCGIGAAFLKELIEEVWPGQDWGEFWVDVFTQSVGVGLGLVAMWPVI